MKGEALSLLMVMTAVSITLGGFLSSVYSTHEVRETVSYYGGDVHTITESQVKADIYTEKLPDDINISFNTVAFELGQQTRSWNDAPDIESIRGELEQDIASKIQDRNRVFGCENPELAGVEYEDREITLSFSRSSVICDSTSTQAEVYLEEEITVNNTENRYMLLVEAALELREEMDTDDLPDSWAEATRPASTDSCEEDLDSDSYRDTARERAENSAVQNNGLASGISGGVDLPGWIELDTSTDFDFDTSITDEDIDDCTGTKEIECPEDEEIEQDEDIFEEDGECKEEFDGQEFDVEATSQVTGATLEFDLSDSEKEVMGASANEDTLHFIFEYDHDMD